MTSADSLPPGREHPSLSLTESAGVNARGAALLASLIEFFKPRTPSSDVTRLCTSAEGQQLLKTLGDFVNLVVNPGVDNGIKGQKDLALSEVEEHFLEDQPNETLLATESLSAEDEFFLLSNLADLYPPPPPYKLPREIIDAANDCVFNGMPIRMITFDRVGTDCTLVERSELVKFILGCIQVDFPTKQSLKQELRDSRWWNRAYFVQEYCQYAILSHTWLRSTPGDVLFHNWANRGLSQNADGNDKIANFCSVAAREHGVQLGWMDTVCINKESSTELDESIRSMYEWYKGAKVCITYLADTLEFAEIPSDTWFTRGWTLQELLANDKIYFYNRGWMRLLPGDFSEHLNDPEFPQEEEFPWIPLEMKYQIFIATSITPRELYVFHDRFDNVPICRIMELAANRRVTRAEDQIYSLMGLLNVSIPTAYGEGSRNALRRMIQQIMITRRDFLDLFNHTSAESILPETIADYIGHTKAQNYVVPKDPLVLSHLGVHATFLAIPLFKEGFYVDFPANNSMVCISWHPIKWVTSINYIALDDSSLSTEWISSLEVPLDAQRMAMDFDIEPPFVFFAILASKIDRDHDSLSISLGNSLGVPLLPDLHNPTDDIVSKSFIDIKPLEPSFYDISTLNRGPVQINLCYSGPNVSGDILTLSTAEAARMGFKVISGHFP